MTQWWLRIVFAGNISTMLHNGVPWRNYAGIMYDQPASVASLEFLQLFIRINSLYKLLTPMFRQVASFFFTEPLERISELQVSPQMLWSLDEPLWLFVLGHCRAEKWKISAEVFLGFPLLTRMILPQPHFTVETVLAREEWKGLIDWVLLRWSSFLKFSYPSLSLSELVGL